MLHRLRHRFINRKSPLTTGACLVALVALTIGGTPSVVRAASNCDPNPQFVDCLTPPLGASGTVNGSTLTLSWTYDGSVNTPNGRPQGVSIYFAGAFGTSTALAFSEAWNTNHPRTSYSFSGLTPGDYAYRVCLNYHTAIIYSDGETFDGYPELCAAFPAGGTIKGASPQPVHHGPVTAPSNLRAELITDSSFTIRWNPGTEADQVEVRFMDDHAVAAKGASFAYSYILPPSPPYGLPFKHLDPRDVFNITVCGYQGAVDPQTPHACSDILEVHTLTPLPLKPTGLTVINQVDATPAPHVLPNIESTGRVIDVSIAVDTPDPRHDHVAWNPPGQWTTSVFVQVDRWDASAPGTPGMNRWTTVTGDLAPTQHAIDLPPPDQAGRFGGQHSYRVCAINGFTDSVDPHQAICSDEVKWSPTFEVAPDRPPLPDLELKNP